MERTHEPYYKIITLNLNALVTKYSFMEKYYMQFVIK